MAAHKSVETKYLDERRELFRGLLNLDRRTFLKVSAAALGATAALAPPLSFTPVAVAEDAERSDSKPAFRFAYISDSHLYEQKVNDRFVRGLLRAVDDVNHLDPQPDFVFYGGDLAQLGEAKQLELGAQILKNLKAPLHIMVGEHDWYLDLGQRGRRCSASRPIRSITRAFTSWYSIAWWNAIFGPPGACRPRSG